MADFEGLNAFQRLVPDPCNAAALRRNTAATRESFEQIVNYITNNLPTEVAGGDELVLFQAIETVPGASSVLVEQRVQDPPGTWLPNGKQFVAFDWTDTGLYSPNFYTGAFGVGRLIADADTPSLEIIVIEGMARYIIGTLTGDMVDDAGTVNRSDFWGAYPNSLDPVLFFGTDISVSDPTGNFSEGKTGDKLIAVWDEKKAEYIVITTKAPTSSGPLPPIGEGELDVVAIKDPLPVTETWTWATDDNHVWSDSDDAEWALSGIQIPDCEVIGENPVCLYSGELQDVTVGATMCGDPWSDAGSVWVIDCRHCGTGVVRKNDRYLASNTGKTFDYQGDVRTIYAIRTEEAAAGGNVQTAQIIAINPVTGDDNCEGDVPIPDNCLFPAKLVGFSSPDNSACGDLFEGATIWALAINHCLIGDSQTKSRVRQGERFIAYPLNSSFGPDGDKRPLYGFRMADPHETKVVEVSGSAGQACEDGAPTDCLYDGVIHEASPIETGCNLFVDQTSACKIVQVNVCDDSLLKKGERYIGTLVGYKFGMPIMAVQGRPATAAKRTMWGRCLSGVYKGSGNCDRVGVQLVDACDGGNDISMDQTKVKKFRVQDIDGEVTCKTGYEVLLPKTTGTEANLEATNVIAFQEASDLTFVCVSDYTDDPIGTIKMWSDSVGSIPGGWKKVDGSQNKVADGGSGINAEGKNIRGGDSAGTEGGRDIIPAEDLAHHHDLSSTENVEACAPDYFEPENPKCHDIPQPPAGTEGGLINRVVRDACFEEYDSAFNDYQHDGSGEVAKDVDDNAIQADFCNEAFGPINIVNAYMTLVLIERVDNSQDFLNSTNANPEASCP